MAENDSDQRPLLLEESEEIEDPVVFSSANVKKMSLRSDHQDLEDDVAKENEKRQQYHSNRQLVVAIFIVSFDTKKGKKVCNK